MTATENTNKLVTYRNCAGNWIAYDATGLAVWESWGEGQLIRDLLAKGYRRENIQRRITSIVFFR